MKAIIILLVVFVGWFIEFLLSTYFDMNPNWLTKYIMAFVAAVYVFITKKKQYEKKNEKELRIITRTGMLRNKQITGTPITSFHINQSKLNGVRCTLIR
jgi:putative Mn2+ efflux pump MntP